MNFLLISHSTGNKQILIIHNYNTKQKSQKTHYVVFILQLTTLHIFAFCPLLQSALLVPNKLVLINWRLSEYIPQLSGKAFYKITYSQDMLSSSPPSALLPKQTCASVFQAEYQQHEFPPWLPSPRSSASKKGT